MIIRSFNECGGKCSTERMKGEVYGITHITRLGFAMVHGLPVRDDIDTKYNDKIPLPSAVLGGAGAADECSRSVSRMRSAVRLPFRHGREI